MLSSLRILARNARLSPPQLRRQLSLNPIHIVSEGLQFLHNTVSLPWWATIVVASVSARVLMYPLTLRMVRKAKAMGKAQTEISEVLPRLKAMQVSDRVVQKFVGDTFKKYNVTPFSMMSSALLSAPVFITFFQSLRYMAKNPDLFAGFASGGALWFSDLTMADPMFILPIAAVGATIFSIEMGGEGQSTKSISPNMRMVMRFAPLLILPFTAKMPAAVMMYWLPTSVFGAINGLLMKVPAFRSFFRLDEEIVPYQEPASKKEPPATVEAVVEGDIVAEVFEEAESRPPVAPLPGDLASGAANMWEVLEAARRKG